MTDVEHRKFMNLALDEARKAFDRGDGPIGCVIVHRGKLISCGGNRVITTRCKLEHAEIVAIRDTAEYLDTHAEDCVLYTTLEPCIMCVGAIAVSGIGQVIYGEPDPVRGGAEAHAYVPYVKRTIKTYRGGILADECAELRARWRRA